MMPCSNMVLWVDARKKGSGKPLRRIKKNSWYSWWSAYLKVEQPEGLVPCTGRVKIEISISYGCECCTGAGVEVEYECDACGGKFYPELPRNTGGLEDLLNEGVVTKAKNTKMQKAHVKEHEGAQERMQQYREQSKIKFAKNHAAAENRKRVAAENKALIAEAKAARKKAKKQ